MGVKLFLKPRIYQLLQRLINPNAELSDKVAVVRIGVNVAEDKQDKFFFRVNGKFGAVHATPGIRTGRCQIAIVRIRRD